MIDSHLTHAELLNLYRWYLTLPSFPSVDDGLAFIATLEDSESIHRFIVKEPLGAFRVFRSVSQRGQLTAHCDFTILQADINRLESLV